MKLLQRIMGDFFKGQNIDLILTVGVAIIASLGAIIGEPLFAELEPYVLVVLALLATSVLVNRYLMETLAENQYRGDLLEQFDQETIRRDLTQAHSITLIGTDLGTVFQLQKEILTSKLKETQSNIRVLLVNPENVSLCQLIAMTDQDNIDTAIEQKRRILKTLRRCQKMVHEAELDVEKIDNIEIRFTDFLPSFGGALLDPNTPHGKIYLWYYPYKSFTHYLNPKLVLTPADKPWYKLFKDQNDALWEDGENVNLDSFLKLYNNTDVE